MQQRAMIDELIGRIRKHYRETGKMPDHLTVTHDEYRAAKREMLAMDSVYDPKLKLDRTELLGVELRPAISQESLALQDGVRVDTNPATTPGLSGYIAIR